MADRAGIPSTAQNTVHDVHTQPNRIRELRKGLGLTVTQLASQIGRDSSTLVRYETGKSPIPDDIKGSLAEIFGCSRSHVMGWDQDAKSEIAAA